MRRVPPQPLLLSRATICRDHPSLMSVSRNVVELPLFDRDAPRFTRDEARAVGKPLSRTIGPGARVEISVQGWPVKETQGRVVFEPQFHAQQLKQMSHAVSPISQQASRGGANWRPPIRGCVRLLRANAPAGVESTHAGFRAALRQAQGYPERP